MGATVDKSSDDASRSFDETIAIRLDTALRARLERVAAANDRSLSGEIRFALRRHLEGFANDEVAA